jgi:glucose/mannose-6-phosphate isomerase
MILDNPKIYKKYDTGRVAESIGCLPDQIRQVLDDSVLVKIPSEYSRVKNIVINGMGGSSLGARILKEIFSDQLGVPISITSGYFVPAYVKRDTLYILSSYSGQTEETLSVYKEVRRRKAKIMAITEKGKGQLGKMMVRDNIPGYVFRPNQNPSNQPRLGVGYMIFGLMVLLAKTGIYKIQASEIKDIIGKMIVKNKELRPESPTRENAAKRIAEHLHGKIPVLVGAEFLTGNLHALRNQLCETSKNFADYLILPDLNHFAMEGLSYPKNGAKPLAFLFFDSALYHPRVQKRSELTKEVVKKNKIKVISYKLSGRSKVEQSFKLLQFGSWITFYLGILNKVNPVEVPWVDWFKKKLK